MDDNVVDQLVSAAASERSLEDIVEKSHYLDHLKKVNDVFYDQIKIADQKAAYLFTFMLAFLVTSTDGREVFRPQRYVEDAWPAAAISAVVAIAVFTTLISAILVVLPRRGNNGTSLYWGAWSNNRAGFLAANQSGDPDFLTREYLGNVDNLSAIARRKFFFVGLAFRGLLVAVIAYIMLIAVQQ